MSYECIIVGGGPAGLSAAIHLGWHSRRVLVIDRRTGPLAYTLIQLYNVPGMPAASGIEILKSLREQAESLGAEVIRANVVRAEGQEGDFRLHGEKGEVWNTETLLLATGVARYHPTVDGDYRPCFKYAGKGNLYYCPDCESPEIRDKDTVVIGVETADGAAGMAIGLSRYTSRLRVLFTSDHELSDHRRAQLEDKGIAVFRGQIAKLEGERSQLHRVILEDGSELSAGAFFVASPARGRTDLAEQLGVPLAPTGYHAQPKSQRGDTEVPGVWVAGDLRPMSQQVSVAMGTGNIAALQIDQSLRKKEVLP